MFYREILAINLIDKKLSFLQRIKRICNFVDCFEPAEDPVFSEVSLVQRVLKTSI